MNKSFLLILLLATAVSAHASENLIINGDFSDGEHNW